VVEKFLPEVENGLYHLRMFQFLGDRWTCTRLASRARVIKANSSVSVERIEPHARTAIRPAPKACAPTRFSSVLSAEKLDADSREEDSSALDPHEAVSHRVLPDGQARA
jgi:hypothetical protein